MTIKKNSYNVLKFHNNYESEYFKLILININKISNINNYTLLFLIFFIISFI
jgi:hypothetical protein